MKIETKNAIVWFGGFGLFAVACFFWMRFLTGHWPR